MTIPTNQLELDKEVLDYKSLKLQNFDNIFNDKIIKITNYFLKADIRHVVIGVSGGIDSAVVLGLLTKVKEIIPLTIHAYTIHFDVYDGIFDSTYIDDLINKFGNKVNFNYVDGSVAIERLFGCMGLDYNNEYLVAQSSYALRYQMLFTYAQKHKAITIGTTNQDEFEYSGWFGKNSDMVVDLQVITDWHKFQVVKAAKLLGVPDSIIKRVPVGDLLDHSTDEENFGCTYDELSYFSSVLLPLWLLVNPFLENKFKKLIELHNKNIHKYQGQTFNPIFIK